MSAATSASSPRAIFANCKRGVELLALTLVFVVRPAVASTPEQLVARVVDLFVRDDLGHLVATVSGDQDLRGRLDELDCITVRGATWHVVARSDDRIELRIAIDATGNTTAAWRPAVSLPPEWHVTAERRAEGWEIVRLLSAERVLAREMLAAPTTADAECLFAGAANPRRTVEQYADVIDDAGRHDRMAHARALAEGLGDARAMVAVLRLDATLRARTHTPGAISVARTAVALAEAHGNADDVADATFALGIAHLFANEMAAARRQFAAAAGMVEQVEYPVMPMKALHMDAFVAKESGMLLDVLRSSERMTDLARRYGWAEGELDALFQIVNVYYALGRPDLYSSYLDDARRIAQRIGHHENVTRLDFNAASVLIDRNRAEEALPLMDAALARSSALPPDERAAIHVGRSAALIALGRFDEAEVALDRAAADEDAANAKTLLARADLELARGRYEAVIEPAREAIEIERIKTFRVASMKTIADAFAAIGRAYRRLGRSEEAIAALRASLSADEQVVARIGVPYPGAAAGALPAYVELVELLVERGDVEEALRIAETKRARSLRDVLERGRVDLSATMTDAERKRMAALEERLAEANRARLGALSRGSSVAELDQTLELARRDIDRFRQQMRVAHPAVARRQPLDGGPPRPPAGADGLAVVEYVVGAAQTIAFVLTGDAEVVAVPIAVSATDLEARTSALSTLMSGRSLAYRAAARRMYDLILAPVEKYLGDRTMCVIPDGPLWSVPFQALVMEGGAFVVERRPVFYASSLALLRHATARQSRVDPSLIAFGNPEVGGAARATVRSAFRDVPLESLADAETEARDISKLYGGSSRVYLRERARENVFKSEAPAFGIVHVAAHAIVDHRAPMYSAIVLATNESDALEDGLLEAREVADLQLEAELAVLSACDTARGQAGYGEGVIGLGWAFQAAGTPTLIVSQWKAESRATAELMIELHGRLRAGETVAEALRSAQLSTRRRYPHPFHWAPFVAVGAAARPVAAAR